MSDPIDWGAVRREPLGARPAPVIDMATAYPNPVGTPNPRAPRRRTGLIVGIATAVVLLLAGLGVVGYALLPGTKHIPVPGKPATFVASGTLEITDGCTGLGYSDIQTGTQVVITDEHQTVLGAGELSVNGMCRWAFTVFNVPAGKTFYGVTISHRGTIQYTEAELRAGVHLSLGG